MATIRRFEDLEIWQLSRKVADNVYQLTLKNNFKKDFSLIDQIRRSSGSVMDNIAEGFERDGKREFIQFLSYSKGSAGETRSQLYRSLDRGYMTKEDFDTLLKEVVTLSVKIQNMISYLKKSDYKGTKFKEK